MQSKVAVAIKKAREYGKTNALDKVIVYDDNGKYGHCTPEQLNGRTVITTIYL